MLLPVYSRPALTIERGEGCYVWDTEGRRYLDFMSGVGVNALGHAHPRILKAVTEQAARCLHTSNLYHHAYQEPLARRLAEWSGLDCTFLSNSGAEAVECALKAAKAYGARQSAYKHRIVALSNSFHGHTLGALSVTGQPKYRHPFAPLLPGVTFIRPNAIEELRAAVTDETCAIVAETIQGEGGIQPLTEAFLREIRRLADHHDALCIADETQCGLGRTGERFAYQRFPALQPDIVTSAKPLAAGLPLGATMLSERAASAFGPGEHGTTFGGGPLACRVALEVLDVIEELLPAIRTNGAYFRFKLGPQARGAGLMVGLPLDTEGSPLVDAAREHGLLINCTQRTVLRFLPPYIVTREHIDEAAAVLDAVQCVMA